MTNQQKPFVSISNKSIKIPSAPFIKQLEMDLRIEKQVERDGIDMGVLSNGVAFLSGRGLARLCGISSSVMPEILADWNIEPQKPRIKKIKEILSIQGLSFDSPIIGSIEMEGTSSNVWSSNVWPETVCVAVLEYYAFDAQQINSEQARRNYRRLAGKGLHDLIYTEVGYDPSHQVPENWRIFHDRVSLTYASVPAGYFGIFKEIADIIVHLGQNGLHIDSTFVPDISIGLGWAKHWTEKKLDCIHGERIKFNHNYPSYFPQAKSNPQHPWCYPEGALGEFRRWVRETYIGEGKFVQYLTNAVKKKELPASFVQLATTAYSNPA